MVVIMTATALPTMACPTSTAAFLPPPTAPANANVPRSLVLALGVARLGATSTGPAVTIRRTRSGDGLDNNCNGTVDEESRRRPAIFLASLVWSTSPHSPKASASRAKNPAMGPAPVGLGPAPRSAMALTTTATEWWTTMSRASASNVVSVASDLA